MKPVDVNSNSYYDFSKKNNKEDPKFKVDYHEGISKNKNIFAKGYITNWSEEVFVIKKVKNAVPWTYIISDCNDEKVVGTFYEKELQKKQIKENLEWKKLLKKAINYTSNGKFMTILLIVGLIKKILLYIKTKIEIKTGLSNCATKYDLRKTAGVNTLQFAEKNDLANFKSEVDKLDIDKLQNVVV